MATNVKPEEIEYIKYLRSKGYSITEISVCAYRSRTTVVRILKSETSKTI